MKATTKILKEQKIIEAAEKVFASFGFKNARMEEVAKEAEITKVTLYAYFRSKENLYMAITYNALQKLAVICDDLIASNVDKPGIESVVAIMEGFMDFCQENPLYSEVLLDYFSLIRSITEDDKKLTDAMKESNYFPKVQALHNYPFKLTAKEIQRGIDDKSISERVEPMVATLYGWTAAVGFVKISAASGSNTSSIFNVRMSDLRKTNLEMQRRLLESYG
ncbi:MAG: TetR/AcrR family transcriptional regulator [Saprospiraceae bacterium]|nr:TetR/AcrR family transcriptional regulator [Saprospiraceae bacterium]MBK7788982.1 TetR/AcrR family transcriptional regulator [Saprospiraceae bacterium]MBK8108905.1 TetR/AcrR family transcriptional regulator [Saprospiraceae bacterium]MBK8849807.1 TetR/AcrR family transcriptional regulator [Saprospiraceae bacterium]MBL0081832.1 TetR/AcrR family transcriptional regulator [Saprospiraceae bacterium]